MANRDQPINGKLSTLSLHRNGNLVLKDAGQLIVWSTDTKLTSMVNLQLQDNGNLVLLTLDGVTLWQSFLSPTDTLLPNQPLTRDTQLVSSRSKSNHSSGFYKLYFDDDNVLRLVFDGLDISSVYWPAPWKISWEAGRSPYNTNRSAVLDDSGNFKSSDNFTFTASDFGNGPWRRLTVDADGNIRLYSLDERRRHWVVSWQAINQPCTILGVCGPNTMCTYVPHENSGSRCSCIPGYKIINHTDWSYGCEPISNQSCDDEAGFLDLPHVEFLGHDSEIFKNYTLERCEKECLKFCSCKGFQYKFEPSTGFYLCYPKIQLRNGQLSSKFAGSMYIKLPQRELSSYDKPVPQFRLDCSSQLSTQLERPYKKFRENGTSKFMLWFATAIGGVEIICILLVWCFLYRTQKRSDATMHGYLHVDFVFKRFSYDELKKATHNFTEVIGRGGGGIVYKGVLSDQRVAAIKVLKEANQGEAEFLAEVSTIGKLNHMNLIDMLGYCAEGKHRLLVYEYMEHGSLADNLQSNTLDWGKRFNVAVGTAKSLAYLHEECLEWVLHCDVKPQNILLDSDFQPKVSDFGLSKLLNRSGDNNSSFSRIRGTRGYMAPEWILNLSITSKVDVYSYGIVVLEMVTGKNAATGVDAINNEGEMEQRRLVKWLREKMSQGTAMTSFIEEIIEPTMKGKYETSMIEILVEVGLQCVEEDRDARPTMNQVVEMLLLQQNDH
ncbi:putative receptor protein kinase ZmPK1 [Cornus florida]|uniref:putative receptor protein kinase ZmPK1 n=1 Tax=Cornus florida TaxID=4283 RepID=UPI0028A1B868|nr:putative receptor protein kinase ZmPK1 [Cornus florida]